MRKYQFEISSAQFSTENRIAIRDGAESLRHSFIYQLIYQPRISATNEQNRTDCCFRMVQCCSCIRTRVLWLRSPGAVPCYLFVLALLQKCPVAVEFCVLRLRSICACRKVLLFQFCSIACSGIDLEELNVTLSHNLLQMRERRACSGYRSNCDASFGERTNDSAQRANCTVG
jgi:hypothetical protein